MLSAFKAQPIHELKQSDKSKIECLVAYGDRLLVGLNTGALRIYRVDESTGNGEAGTDAHADKAANSSKSKVVGLLQERDKFGKKPIQQLAIIKEANLLVSLSDSHLSLHDLQTYELVERLEQTRGAACFAVTSNIIKDPETDVPGLVSRLAVGSKRKILCWTWQDMEQLPNVAEISLESSIKTLHWADATSLIVGMDPGFAVVNIITQEVVLVNKPMSKSPNAAEVDTGELAGVRFGAVSSSGMGYMGMGSWVPKPMATPMSTNEVLLAKDVNTLFISTDGKALDKRQVPWALAPEAIGYSYPYLLALNPPDKGTLQVRNPESLSLLQTISVPGANILHVPQPNISLAHAGKGFLVASDRVIWRMNALPYDTQLAELIEKQKFDEAISLINLLEDTLIDDKAGRIREVMTLKATSLFQQQKYRPALDLFTDAETSPDRVIALYPRSIAGDLSRISEDSSDADPDADAENEESKAGDAKKEAPSPSRGMFGKLRGGKKVEADTASIRSTPRGDVDNMSVRTRRTTKGQDKPLEGDDLRFAVKCLCTFLPSTRVKMQKYLTPTGTLKDNPVVVDSETGKPPFSNLLPQSIVDRRDEDIEWQTELLKTAQLVDTTLFRAYMMTQPSLVGPLFRIANFCNPEVVRSTLYESERYHDLIEFLHGKRLHRQALEMLAKFGKDEADGEVPSGMRGPERTVAYLKQLPPELVDLILEFVKWPIAENPDAGMEVFLADSDNAEGLPRQRIVDFLASISGGLELRYLEHIIGELGEDGPEFHQQLIDLYIQELKQDSLGEEERIGLKGKLEAFLLRSKAFNKAKTKEAMPADDPIFYEARALVFGAMGNHEMALSIYVFQMQDYNKAESYCSRRYLDDQADQHARLFDRTSLQEKAFPPFEHQETGYHHHQHHNKTNNNNNNSSTSNIFAILLKLYLKPSPPEQKRWPQALELLSNHGARLPAHDTLQLMPVDLPVQALQDYFRGRIRNATAILRVERIVKGLEEVRADNLHRRLLVGPDHNPDGRPLGRNRRVRIADDDHCSVCHRRFGTTAVRVYPNNDVVHYACLNNRGGGRGMMNRNLTERSRSEFGGVS